MPNGGVPLHMVITPRTAGTHVVYCNGAVLRALPKEEWEARTTQASPSLVLTPVEARVLERFLRYWLQDAGEGPIYRSPEVDVEYDF